MRARRFAVILAFAPVAIAGVGCIGVGTSGSWPPGAQAIVQTGTPQVLAEVPIGQRHKTGGLQWVPIARGTRVVCLDGLGYTSSGPYLSDPSLLAVSVRVKPLTGAYSGIDLVVQRGKLDLAPDPMSDWAVILLFVWVCLSAAIAFIAGCADRLRRRSGLVRRWSAAHPGERFGDRLRSHRMSPVPLHRREQDYARWLAWIANRNGPSKTRGNSSGLRPVTGSTLTTSHDQWIG